MGKLSLTGRLKVARYAAEIATAAGQNEKFNWSKESLVELLDESYRKMINLIEDEIGVAAGEGISLPAKSR